jgi:hypothetical protein
MHIPVENIGVLYDKIIETGTLQGEAQHGKRNTLYKSSEDIETALRQSVFGRGQLLFLTRQLDVDQTDKLLNTGFRFAGVQHVGRNLAETMQIPLAALEIHMGNLRQYVENLSTMEKAGTWLSLFAIIPKANSKGFDIAVKRSQQDQLPDIQLLPFEPLPWQAAFLERLTDVTTSVCFAFLDDYKRQDISRTAQEQHFANAVKQGLNNIKEQVPRSWFQNARFVGTPVYAHYSQPLNSRAHVTTLYSLVVCADLHSSIEGCSDITRVPLSFFSTRQQCFAGSPNHIVLARDIHQEFGPLLTRKGAKNNNLRDKKFSRRMTASRTRRPSVAHSGSEPSEMDYSSDTHELVDKPRHLSRYTGDATAGAGRDTVWGGILVNSETVVKSDSKSESNADIHTHDLGIRVAVGTSKPETTFVDELFAIARDTIATTHG